MKKSFLHIALPVLLICNLLFSQVALEFLHNKHDAHELIVKQKDGKFSIQKHGEHCKLCSIEVLFNLLIEPKIEIHVPATQTVRFAELLVLVERIHISFTRDRAPPLS